MLTLLLSFALAQVPDHLTLEVGETRRVVIPGLQRIAVSASCYEARPAGGDRLDLTGVCAGRATLLAWLRDGGRVTMRLTIEPARAKPKSSAVPVREAAAGAGSVSVFTFPEELVEPIEVQEVDGGLRLVGRNRAGERLEVLVTPKNPMN